MGAQGREGGKKARPMMCSLQSMGSGHSLATRFGALPIAHRKCNHGIGARLQVRCPGAAKCLPPAARPPPRLVRTSIEHQIDPPWRLPTQPTQPQAAAAAAALQLPPARAPCNHLLWSASLQVREGGWRWGERQGSTVKPAVALAPKVLLTAVPCVLCLQHRQSTL